MFKVINMKSIDSTIPLLDINSKRKPIFYGKFLSYFLSSFPFQASSLSLVLKLHL